MHLSTIIEISFISDLVKVTTVPYYLANMPPFFANQHRLQVWGGGGGVVARFVIRSRDYAPLPVFTYTLCNNIAI